MSGDRVEVVPDLVAMAAHRDLIAKAVGWCLSALEWRVLAAIQWVTLSFSRLAADVELRLLTEITFGTDEPDDDQTAETVEGLRGLAERGLVAVSGAWPHPDPLRVEIEPPTWWRSPDLAEFEAEWR